MDMMRIVKDVDALVLFYIIVALTSYGITSAVCDIFRWVHKSGRILNQGLKPTKKMKILQSK